MNFVRIQAVIEIFNSARCAGNFSLAGCLDTHIPSLISSASVIFLNAVLATCALFIFQASPTVMFGTQLIGNIIAALLILERWHYRDTPKNSLLQCASAFWKKPQAQIKLESPRNTPINEEMNIFSV